MSKPANAEDVAYPVEGGKPRFHRKRKKVLNAVEEIRDGGNWRARTSGDRGFSGEVRFRVAGLYVAGRRVRRFFATEEEANEFITARTLKEDNLGERANNVEGRLMEDAVEADALLKDEGLRLLDAVRDILAAREALKAFPEVTMLDAAKHYAAVLADRERSWTVDEAAERWLASRKAKGRSDSYLWDANRRLAKFREPFGGRSLADITTADVDGWVNGLGVGSQTVRNYLTVVSSMFSYAVKQKRSPRNPVSDVERPDVVRDEAGILTPDELRRLLAVLPDDTVPYVALGAFAGLRPMEVRRLKWEDINFQTGYVTVKSGTAKTKRRRTVPITDNLRAWLKPLAQESGPVVKLADLTVRQKRLAPARKKAKLANWPHDCLRHSAATYWLHNEGDAARVALWLGHTQEVLHAHYKGLLTDPAHAAEWFAIMPPKDQAKGKIIPMKAA